MLNITIREYLNDVNALGYIVLPKDQAPKFNRSRKGTQVIIATRQVYREIKKSIQGIEVKHLRKYTLILC